MSRTILITGANGGLGNAVVERFLAEGYRVIATGRSDRANEKAKTNPLYEYHAVNLEDESEAGAFIATMIGKHQRIHGALLLVGGFDMGNIESTDGQALKKMYSMNFETAYFTSRPLFTHMQQHGYGRIVLIGARPALQSSAGKGSIAYTLSKTLLFKLAELLNETAKAHNVVTSVVAPGIIDTPTNRKDMPDADTSKWVQPAQIADLLEFICSEKGDALREPVYKMYGNS